MSFRLFSVFSWVCLVLLASAGSSWGETKLLRFPDIHGDRIVFCYAGDLWLVDSSGGRASRLTAHPGQELFPKFSPDGKWIAFTGQYDGDEQVYVIPTEGGIPKQLTYYPAQGPVPPGYGHDHQVYGWTRDGKAVLFRSLRYAWHYNRGQLFTVPLDGGLPDPLPMPMSGGGDFSPNGKEIVYSPLMRDFRTWKRYEGGWAQNLYTFDLTALRAKKITKHPRSDRDPMWVGNRIYFSSDRDGTLNLFSYDLSTEETKKHTDYKVYDLRWPSSDGLDRIVFELNGALHLFHLDTEKVKKISVRVPNDGIAMRPSRVSAHPHIESWGLSPKGERALFSARGDIFSAPIEKGSTRNLTRSSDAHDKWPSWSPDGNQIAFLSDRDGEEELYLVNQDGSGEIEQLTHGGKAMRFLPRWSPDGERIAFSDKNGKIFVLEVKNKTLKEIADDPVGLVFDYTWSPHGGYLAFSLGDEAFSRSVYVWDARKNKLHRITGPYFNEFNPVWGSKGKYLFYLSIRTFDAQGGAIERNFIHDREVNLYALALREDVEHPFPPESDEVSEDNDEKGKADQKEKTKDETKNEAQIKIDFEGLSKRVAKVPVSGDNYKYLSAVDGHLLYIKTGPTYYGRKADVVPSLFIFSLKDRKETLLAGKASGYEVSFDGKKVMVREGASYHLYDANPKGKSTKKNIAIHQLKSDRVPSEEWAQIFDEVWRRFRDFFYVENMHGYDWEEIRERYRPLLKEVAHRSDLNYLLGEMVSELNVSHAYIRGGMFDVPSRAPVALPGVRLEKDPKANRYRIGEIYRGQNEESHYRVPLREIGIQVREGDYILSIEGEELTGAMNPYRLLRHKANQEVSMTVNDKPTTKGAKTLRFKPIKSETNLLYFTWVDQNRERVAKKTEGRVGYLHIPDMGANGVREFTKWFYGQIRKEGLIIDVRGNRGGHISQMLIERLRRSLLAIMYSRNNDFPSPYPSMAFNGYLVCILNETSASDGDIFAEMFKKAQLGPLIGKRSWGGVVGIQDRGPLMDGGQVFVPEFGFASSEGEWIIENYGVEPDIIVENDPESMIKGEDPQLDRAIQEIMVKIKEAPRKYPPKPPGPVKTK